MSNVNWSIYSHNQNVLPFWWHNKNHHISKITSYCLWWLGFIKQTLKSLVWKSEMKESIKIHTFLERILKWFVKPSLCKVNCRLVYFIPSLEPTQLWPAHDVRTLRENQEDVFIVGSSSQVCALCLSTKIWVCVPDSMQEGDSYTPRLVKVCVTWRWGYCMCTQMKISISVNQIEIIIFHDVRDE